MLLLQNAVCDCICLTHQTVVHVGNDWPAYVFAVTNIVIRLQLNAVKMQLKCICNGIKECS